MIFVSKIQTRIYEKNQGSLIFSAYLFNQLWKENSDFDSI